LTTVAALPKQEAPGADAMNVQMNMSAPSERDERLCGYCRRPWFGWVAYCPYCGREASFATINQEPDDRPQGDEAVASRQGTLGTTTGELPVFDKNISVERDRPVPSQLSKTASALLFKILVAGVTALLLLWMMGKLLAPKPNEGASPHPPIATSGIAPPTRGPLTSATQVPSIPRRTESAVPPRSSKPPCSVAHEAAGLCISQE
jgi:hypothetical protein